MICHKCNNKIDLSGTKLKFREICEVCGVDMHVCKNCKYYVIGKPNNCIVPNTELIPDRERFNFCEDFFPINEKQDKTANKKDIEKKLFGDEGDDSPSSFGSLFK